MKPRSLSCTPASLRPMFSVLTARPAAIRTTAASTLCLAPLASTSKATRSLPTFAFVTFAPAFHFLSGLDHPRALHDRPLVLLHQELDALRILVPPPAGTLHGDAVVRLDGARLDAELLGLAQQLGDVGRMQQRLGGDAADVHAYSAQLLFLDQRGRQAQLRSPDGGDVARRAAAQDQHVELVRHWSPLRAALRVGSRASASASAGTPPPSLRR